MEDINKSLEALTITSHPDLDTRKLLNKNKNKLNTSTSTNKLHNNNYLGLAVFS
jgi:hypothetical protein